MTEGATRRGPSSTSTARHPPREDGGLAFDPDDASRLSRRHGSRRRHAAEPSPRRQRLLTHPGGSFPVPWVGPMSGQSRDPGYRENAKPRGRAVPADLLLRDAIELFERMGALRLKIGLALYLRKVADERHRGRRDARQLPLRRLARAHPVRRHRGQDLVQEVAHGRVHGLRDGLRHHPLLPAEGARRRGADPSPRSRAAS